MTPILYAKPDIKDVLIEAGERTWTDVESVLNSGLTTVGMDFATGVVMFSASAAILRFTFADEPAAMAFRLRYSDYLVDRPRHPDCDALMALEAACCAGGPQWGHAWECPTLP